MIVLNSRLTHFEFAEQRRRRGDVPGLYLLVGPDCLRIGTSRFVARRVRQLIQAHHGLQFAGAIETATMADAAVVERSMRVTYAEYLLPGTTSWYQRREEIISDVIGRSTLREFYPGRGWGRAHADWIFRI
jgi:hypothetical protein